MDNLKYNSQGVAESQPLGSQSPESNPGVVYNPANIPTNPGSSLSGQTVSQQTFQSNYSGRRIRITMSPGVDPVQAAGSLAIIDAQGNIVFAAGDTSNPVSPAVIFATVSGNHEAIDVVGTSGGGVRTVPLVSIVDFDNSSVGPALFVQDQGTGSTVEFSANGGIPLRLDQAFTTSSHFKQMAILGTVNVWTSDGTTPNGVLSGSKGDICLNSSGTGQIAYNNNGTTGWTLL